MSIQSKHFLDLIHSPTHEVRPAHFEIACMGADDQIRKALRFSQGDLEAAKAFASEINIGDGATGSGSVYYTPAKLGAPRKAGRSSDADFEMSQLAWCDCDNEQSVTALEQAMVDGRLIPLVLVQTATLPHRRLQALFPLPYPIYSAQELKTINSAVARSLGSDQSVVNATSLLRLPGCLNFPSAKKRAGGRIEELVTFTFNSDATPLDVERLILEAQPENEKSGMSDARDVRKALQQYWNADDYNDWAITALALHSFPDGKNIWIEWARTSAKFDPIEVEKKWSATNPNRGITVKSLFHRVPPDIRRAWAKDRFQSGAGNSRSSGKWFRDDDAWNIAPVTEAPRPLFRPIAEGKPFPLAELRGVLEPAARAIVDIVQCPEGLAGQSVLAVASLAVQAHANVVIPATGQGKPTSLFLMSVAGSGERKSAADKEALGPVHAWEEALNEQYKGYFATYRDEHDAWDASRKEVINKLKGKGFAATSSALAGHPKEPEKPLAPIVVCPEPTIEGLLKLFIVGQPSMGIFSDEGGAFINGHGMSEENRLKSAALFSQLWDGSSVKRVRAGDGAAILSGRRLALHIMAQPDAAARMLSDAVLADQGFLSRFLVCAPASNAGRRFQRDPLPSSRAALEAYKAHTLRVFRQTPRLVENTQNELAPRMLHLDALAASTWRGFADHVEGLLSEGEAYASIRGFANKLPEHATRIAGVLTLIDNPDATEVSDDALLSGIALAEFYAQEALRLFETGHASPLLMQAEKLRVWLLTTWTEQLISIRAIVRLGPNSMRTSAHATEAVNILVEHGWLQYVGAATVDCHRVKHAWKIVRGAAS